MELFILLAAATRKEILYDKIFNDNKLPIKFINQILKYVNIFAASNEF